MKKHLIVFGTLVWQALIYILAPAVLFLVFDLLWSFSMKDRLDDTMIGFSMDIFTLFSAIVFFGIYKKDRLKKLFPSRLEFRKLVSLIPISLAARIPIVIFVVVAMIFFGDQVLESMNSGIDYQWSMFGDAVGAQRVLVFLSFVILGPIHEEIFFRAVMFEYLRSNYSHVVAILYGTTIFTLFHFHPGLFPSSFILGLVLVFVYIKWKNLGYSIILHMLINVHPFILSYLSANGQ